MTKQEALDLALDLSNIDLELISAKHSVDINQLYNALLESKPLRQALPICSSRATAISKDIVPDKHPKHNTTYGLLAGFGLKQCPKCSEVYFLDEFHSGGYYCAACSNRNTAEWFKENAVVRAEYSKTYAANNRAVLSAKQSEYQARKIQAVPKWANFEAIKVIYETCPEGWHVDHVVPLRGKNVCGLHVENNLQHLPALDNIRKSNKFESEC